MFSSLFECWDIPNINFKRKHPQRLPTDTCCILQRCLPVHHSTPPHALLYLSGTNRPAFWSLHLTRYFKRKMLINNFSPPTLKGQIISRYLSNGPVHGRNWKGAAAKTPSVQQRLSDATDLSQAVANISSFIAGPWALLKTKNLQKYFSPRGRWKA